VKFNFTLLTLKREITPKNDQKSLGLIQKKFSTAFGGRHRKKKGTPKKYNTPTRKKVEAEQQKTRDNYFLRDFWWASKERRKKRNMVSSAQMSKLLIGFYDIIEPFSANRYVKLWYNTISMPNARIRSPIHSLLVEIFKNSPFLLRFSTLIGKLYWLRLDCKNVKTKWSRIKILEVIVWFQ